MKVDIKSLNREELTELLTEKGEKRFRADQLYDWMHVKLARNTDEMTNIPGKLREYINNECDYTSLGIVDRQISASDGTRKYLFLLNDGNMIESVWMKYREWTSICISSQVGCRMGCRFCASTIDGCVRSLKTSEMLDQVYAVQRDTGERISNIVVMGSGEPLDNYVNLIGFIKMISDEKGLNIGERHITVSTCGLVPEIKRLADEKLQITLALSLHAPDDETRRRIMPIAEKYPLSEVIPAIKYYFEKTGRRVTFEYALSEGVNDSVEDAEKLAHLLKELKGHLNLIPVNPVKERDFRRSGAGRIASFKSKLEKNGINVTIRREMGKDIDGACGQLRRKHLEGNTNA